MSPPEDTAARHIQSAASDFIAGRDRLLAMLISLVGDRHVAEDVFQEVWVRLSDAVAGGEKIDNVPAWSRQTAKFLVLNHWRKRGRFQAISADQFETLVDHVDHAFADEASAGAVWGDRLTALASCLQRLAKRSRAAIALRYEQGLSVAETAQESGMSFSAMTKLLYRTRKQLADCIERDIRLRSSLTRGSNG